MQFSSLLLIIKYYILSRATRTNAKRRDSRIITITSEAWWLSLTPDP